MDMLWDKLQWNPPLYMKPISFQSKASVVCSVTTAVFIEFAWRNEMCFLNILVKWIYEFLNSAEQIPRNWNFDQVSVLIAYWDLT